MDNAEAVRERAFGIFYGHTKEGRDPHPEQGSRSAETNSQRHSGDVADTDGGGECRGESLKMGNVTFVLRIVVLAPYDVETVLQMANLNPSQAEGDEHSRAKKDKD